MKKWSWSSEETKQEMKKVVQERIEFDKELVIQRQYGRYNGPAGATGPYGLPPTTASSSSKENVDSKSVGPTGPHR